MAQERNKAGVATGGVVYMSGPEARQYVDRQARRLLGVSSARAFSMVDSGELSGTQAEAELSLLRGLVSKSRPR
jgi:hypothetical protein